MDNQQNIDTRLEGWNKQEKFQLLQALKDCGSQNIKQICCYISTKSEEQIKKAIQFYKEKAAIQTKARLHDAKRKKNTPIIPLASWAKCLTDSYGFDELQTETSTALRLIADFEVKPLGVCTEKIDFRKVYHLLADATEGKSLPNENSLMAIIDKCIIETALTSKAFIKNTSYKQFLQSINVSEMNINAFIKPTDNMELATLRHLSSQANYNPLNITEKYLKSSSYEK